VQITHPRRYPEAAIAVFIAATFIGACALGYMASTLTSTVAVSKTRAEAAALARVQQRHPGESYLVTRIQFQLLSNKVSDSVGQSYGSSWTACFTSIQGSSPLGLLRCPPPAVWAVELTTASKQQQALVVVDAQSGAVDAVLIHSTESTDFVKQPPAAFFLALNQRFREGDE
jgi:hypothetical protein